MNKRYLLGAAALLFAARVWAGEVAVSGAWIEANAPMNGSTMVFMAITSQKDARLVAVSSPESTSTQIHTMKMENGSMMMHIVGDLVLPAKKEIVLSSSGDHIHLIGLKRTLKAGDIVPLTLTIEFPDKSKEDVLVKAEVRPSAESHEMQGMPKMPGMY